MTPPQRVAEALKQLSAIEDGAALADTLGHFCAALASAAAGSQEVRLALTEALARPSGSTMTSSSHGGERKKNRRAKGILDPFLVYAEIGESGLRSQLSTLDLEKLRDILAEQRMDPDRLAMRWKAPERVIERIVELVVSRSAKGSAFRR
jgi:hypothetical protein